AVPRGTAPSRIRTDRASSRDAVDGTRRSEATLREGSWPGGRTNASRVSRSWNSSGHRNARARRFAQELLAGGPLRGIGGAVRRGGRVAGQQVQRQSVSLAAARVG